MEKRWKYKEIHRNRQTKIRGEGDSYIFMKRDVTRSQRNRDTEKHTNKERERE
jgi:hypothetical protein